MRYIQSIMIVFIVLSIVTGSFIIPIGFALYHGEWTTLPAFILPMSWIWGITLILILISTTQKRRIRLSIRESIILVCSSWVGTCLIGTLPFLISGHVAHFSDAMFESVSGFTTTGASALATTKGFPVSLQVWRTQMHWLGGMGVVALTVALFPLLGVGGFQLIKSETSGPDKGKLTAKITHTAKALWMIYLGMTVVEVALLTAVGMPFMDALCHSFSTLGTGGFSTRSTSIGFYKSPAVEIICTIFMILAGVNFSIYFYLFTGRISEILHNSEFRAYVRIVLAAGITIAIAITPTYGLATAFRYSFFHTASIVTTTGFSTVDFNTWPYIAQAILVTLMFIGGCSGSTAGGIKVIRWVIFRKQARNEILRLLHPHGVFSIQLNNRPGRKDVVYSVSGFFFIYFLCLFITFIVATLAGADILTGITSALTLVGNIGASFGQVGSGGNFSFYPHWAKLFFSISMLAGRLELYTIIIFFVPAFYQK